MPDIDDDLIDADDLVATLRKQIKEKDKALKELSEGFTQMREQSRNRLLTDAFKERKLPERLAKFYPSDADPSSEGVDAWLAENAEVFGFKQDAGSGDDGNERLPDGFARLQTIQSPQGDSGGDAALIHQITNATTEAEILQMITAAGGGGIT